MGGTGTWSMLSRFPNYFAAAMPCAANPTGCDAQNVATTAVMTVMGSADRIMSVETAMEFVDQLTEENSEVVFNVVDGWSHEQTCTESYTYKRLEWLFSHSRNDVTKISSLSHNATTENKAIYTIDGKRLTNIPREGLFVINGKIYKK